MRMPASVTEEAKRSTARPHGRSHATMRTVWSPRCMARRCCVARLTTCLSCTTVSSGSHARLTTPRSSHLAVEGRGSVRLGDIG